MSHNNSVFSASDHLVNILVDQYPELAVSALGIKDRDGELNRYSYDGNDELIPILKKFLDDLDRIHSTNVYDQRAKLIIKSDIVELIEDLESKQIYMYEGVTSSIFSNFLDLLDLLTIKDIYDLKLLKKRLSLIREAINQHSEAYQISYDKGKANTKYNITKLINQAREIATSKKYQSYVKAILSEIECDLTLADKIILVANEVEEEHFKFAEFLETIILPQSREEIGIGVNVYEKIATNYTYKDINLNQLYELGVERLEYIRNKIKMLSEKILPGAQISEVLAYLNGDDKYLIKGEVALVKELNTITEQARKFLIPTYFDMDPRVQICEVRLNVDSLDASPYYTGPSEDLSRPGITWYPTLGKESFSLWPNVTTWYHEGFPGHHLQCGYAILNSNNLSRYQRLLAWHGAYGEGWALYAETLMYNLGFFNDPAYELGYWQSQALRAARVILDIGIHCNLEKPGGGFWDVESAVKFLEESALLELDYAQSEIDRYLADPGQAITYFVGEKAWTEMYNLFKKSNTLLSDKDFYAFTLGLGSMKLDAFTHIVTAWVAESAQTLN